MKHVAISLLNYKGKENTLSCLDSLRNAKKDTFELSIIVIDNASNDGLSSATANLKKPIPNLRFIQNEKNLGFSGGHNVAIKYALQSGADYVLILNNDTYVDFNFLQELVDAAEKDRNIGIVVPKIYFAPGFEFHKDRYSTKEQGRVIWYAGGKMDWDNVRGYHRGVDEVDRGQYDKVEATEFATGCCMLIKKEVFEKIELLDDKYFLYYEDSDFSVRLLRNGFKIMYIPTSVIFHKNAGSMKGSGSSIQDYYITRNRLLFGMKYAPVRAKLALIKESIKLVFRGRPWQKRGVIDYYLGNFGKGNYKNE